MRAALRVAVAATVVSWVGAALVTPHSADAQRKKRKKAETELEDVTQVKADFIVLTDGEGSFIAVDPNRKDDHWLFYGDGKTFHRLRVGSGSADGTQGTWSKRFWSPRVAGRADLDARVGGKYVLRCADEEIELKKLASPEARRIVDRAVWKKPLWKRQAHFLARDDRGNYYYVDRLRDEHGGKGHRIFAGLKGALKELPMTNIVSDSMGEIYATRKGELRFVTSRNAAHWARGAAKTELTIVPVEDNVAMIYGDLGVYEGSLGTPCDEF